MVFVFAPKEYLSRRRSSRRWFFACVRVFAPLPARNRAGVTLLSWPPRFLLAGRLVEVVWVTTLDVVSFEEHGVIHEVLE